MSRYTTNEATRITISKLVTPGPSLLNRGKNGEAKTQEVGGISRVRISSASQKFAISSSVDYRDAERTRLIDKLVESRVDALNLNKNDSAKVMEFAVNAIKSGDEVHYIGTIELDTMFDYIKENVDKILDSKKSDKAATELRKVMLAKAPIPKEICINGRMEASGKLKNVESSVLINHMYSVDEYAADSNFFICADTLKLSNPSWSEDNDKGAAMLGDIDITSNTLYGCYDFEVDTFLLNYAFGRYDLSKPEDVEQLKKEATSIILKHIDAYFRVLPKAHRTDMLTAPTPDLIFVEVGKNFQNRTYDSEFNKVVRPTSLRSVVEIAKDRIAKAITEDPYTRTLSSIFAGEDLGVDRKRFWIEKDPTISDDAKSALENAGVEMITEANLKALVDAISTAVSNVEFVKVED